MDRDELVIDAKGLRKSFDGHVAVAELSLAVKRGEVFGFLGPNGSGKTTTLRMLCGLLTPDAGGGTCLGYDVLRESRRIKCHVGYMPQGFSLYTDLTVRENLLFMCRLYGLPNRADLVSQQLEALGLIDRRHQLVAGLSGGWKQRLALACALVHQPDLLLLDEPTAGVDPSARRDFWDTIHGLSQRGMTTLVTTHYMDEAARCTRLAYMVDGDMLSVGTHDEIVSEVGLLAWLVSGTDRLAWSDWRTRLLGCEGVDQVGVFGSDLQVVASTAAGLTSIRQEMEGLGLRWRSMQPSTENVFIYMVGQREVNTL